MSTTPALPFNLIITTPEKGVAMVIVSLAFSSAATATPALLALGILVLSGISGEVVIVASSQTHSSSLI